MEVCGVKFKDNGLINYFYTNNLEITKGSYVIVQTEKGERLGKVDTINNRKIKDENQIVLRLATDQDYKRYLDLLKESNEALNDAKKFAKKLGLIMQFVDSYYNFDKTELTLNFVADERIDFRELVRMIASKYKVRIDLHQIGIRDKAKEIGGIGQCGMQTCCHNFLNHIDTITINMAKNQNIAINPSKVNGTCGRLLCCLLYEDENYTNSRNKLPNIGEFIKYEKGNYKVISNNILKESYTIDYDGENKEIFINNEE